MSEQFKGYLKNGCGLIAAERSRQIHELDWDQDHDDAHSNGELIDAGASYAMASMHQERGEPLDSVRSMETAGRLPWPWESSLWNPSVHIERNLVKAGALISAEIDRRYRAFQRDCNEITVLRYGFKCFDEMDAYDLYREDWIGISPYEFVRQHFADMTRINREEDSDDES